MTTALYLLRSVELGLSVADLDLLEVGMVLEMFAESQNDEWDGWSYKATQADFDRF